MRQNAAHLTRTLVWRLKHAYGNAEILVTNRGAGIPSDELPLLFDRYVRSRAAETGTARGLGLGLYIARGLVEAHHGHIWAESVPGDVTTFHVVIPLDGPPVQADAPASDEAAASHPELAARRMGRANDGDRAEGA
jgi:signal transduction histidine kinase